MNKLFEQLAQLHKGGSGDDDFAERLLVITDGCRPDMHEPDEQELHATVTGDHLDNAGFGPELTIHMTRDAQKENFNIASLIAYARIGAALAVATEAIERTARGNKYGRK